ncbi:MAG: phosphoglycerate dehydrogenase [Firmicutes bacterium]|nr:phosphoglycerate dehydrogenase [Bacillota bacterium]MCD8311609.1 phosphoglycerate dehydrogenase [Bacillota bacterium]
MKKIKLMNKISKAGIEVFDTEKYEVSSETENPDAIMVRSASLHETEFSENLLAIARAGAGYNNIPVDKCSEAGIVVFNTPGANANAVKELAVAAIMLASRDIAGGIEWAKTIPDSENVAKAVEAGKSKFAGQEIMGKTLGVIGLGAVGGLVANTAVSLGMNVVGCDPFLSVDAAWRLSRAVTKAASYDEIYAASDYITIHAPSTPETRGMINKETISKMRDGVRIINLARADLVNAADMTAALESGKVAVYVTDFPTNEIIGVRGVVAIPHLGASTEESEVNCAVMAARQLVEYIELGNIKNSVNFPNVTLPHTGDYRLCVLHKNIPAMLSGISSVISSRNINIETMTNRSRGEYAYTIVEIKGELPDECVGAIREIDGVLRVNVIK